jgi:GNAT superfamily N-acetyltransferase
LLIARAYEDADEPAVLELLQTVFGSWPRGIESLPPREFFRWKHVRGPRGRSTLFVAEHAGVLAGFVAYMPWPLRVDGQLVQAVRGVDLAVHPHYRRRGVSQALRAAAGSLLEGALLWANPNDPANRGGLKDGRHPSGRVPLFARFCWRVPQSARRALSGELDTSASVTVRPPKARDTLADEEYVSRLLASIPHPAGRLATDRNVNYLRWRYGHFPEYHAVVSSAKVGSSGIAIFRLRPYGRFWVLDVSELLAEGMTASVQRDLLANVSNAAAADFLVCNFPSWSHAARHGFVQVSRGGNIYTHAPTGAHLRVDPARPGAWALSRGDLELL